MATAEQPTRKPLVRLSGEIKTPPFSKEARVEAGALLRRLQEGELLHMPHSRPMPSVGPRCHEIRVRDENRNWRVVYRLDADAIVIAGGVFEDHPRYIKARHRGVSETIGCV
jgi:hypothetical protein